MCVGGRCALARARAYAGCPVVCSDIPALREVGGAAPWYVAPGDAAGLTAALMEVGESRAVRQHAAWVGTQTARGLRGWKPLATAIAAAAVAAAAGTSPQ